MEGEGQRNSGSEHNDAMGEGGERGLERVLSISAVSFRLQPVLLTAVPEVAMAHGPWVCPHAG